MIQVELERLFFEGLQLLYGAHHQGAEQAASNRDTSTSPKLRQMLQAGSKMNLAQARRLEQVSKAAGFALASRPDQAMRGIIEANRIMIAETTNPVARDLVNIAAGQLAAHFYLANYGTLRTYAKSMRNKRAASLLQRTLNESGNVDKAFTKLGRRLLRRSISADVSAETALRSTVAMRPVITTVALLGLAAAGAAMAAWRNSASDEGI